MVLPATNLLAITLTLFAAPRHMPPIKENDAVSIKEHLTSTSDYAARKNHPTSYDDNPLFKGPFRLEQRDSPDFHRRRIREYCLANERIDGSRTELPNTLGSSTPTQVILESIVAHLARRDAPVDAKEVAESIEFYLRCGKRLLGAARRVLKNQQKGAEERSIENTITIHDLCAGHGLTGLLFVACNPPGRFPNTRTRAVLVDQFEPKSHSILRDCMSEICPWVAESVSFEAAPLEAYAARGGNADEEAGGGDAIAADARHADIIISTHACGALTDRVLDYSAAVAAAAVAVMPCCYTGTDRGAPYGVRRLLGVGVAADVRRSFALQDRGYLVDFAAIPRAVTPMNRIVVGERRK